ALLFPMKLLNGGPPLSDPNDDSLAVDLRLLAGSTWGSGAQLGVRFGTRLVHFPGFGEPGQGAQFGFAGNVSGLSVDARGGSDGLTDMRFAAGAGLATVYQRWIASADHGWDLLASAGVAYEIRQHNWGSGPIDTWSSVHLPGVGIQLRRMDGPFQVTLRADLGLTFCGARSFLLDGSPSALGVDTLTTTQRAWGYTMGWGISAAPSLEIAYGPLSVDLGAALDTRYSLGKPDPWPDRNPTADLSDTWSSIRGGVRYRLPWNDLQISASIERNLRRGSAGTLSRTAGETVVLGGVGFAL
ncbi:MAG TPA: hypothetical protein VG496_07745, partial [Myxococcales bacterium]|nr:hypothetical protein [Myxococcales bacterium]